MKKRFPSFLAGAASALALTALCATALAASGKVSYNFVNVSFGGETRIAAGQDIAAANGQRVPGSILYTDAAGGKTNYLPIRTVSELLGVEIGYDAASKTVLLGPSAQEEGAAQTACSAGLWRVVVEDGCLSYRCEEEGSKHDSPPVYLPNRLPEGWTLEQVRGIARGGSASWYFQTPGGGSVHFLCGYPGKATFADGSFSDLEAVVKGRQTVRVQGYGADFYTEKPEKRVERSLLAWENGDGILFHLTGTGVSREDLLYLAESIRPVTTQAASWKMNWLPEGSAPYEDLVLGDTLLETRLVSGTNASLLVSSLPLSVPGEVPEEAVTVHGRAARFYPAREPMTPRELETKTVGDVSITHGVVSGFGAADMNTLLWSDPGSGVNLRLISGLDRETMVKIAESAAP